MVKRLRLEEAIETVQAKTKTVFKKGREKTGGRVAGTKNKMPTILKEAIMLAMHEEGSDGKGTDGVVGALRKAWKTERREFLKLASKLLPYQLTGKDGSPLQMEHTTREQLVERFKERGLPMPPSLLDMPTHSPTKN